MVAIRVGVSRIPNERGVQVLGYESLWYWGLEKNWRLAGPNARTGLSGRRKSDMSVSSPDTLVILGNRLYEIFDRATLCNTFHSLPLDGDAGLLNAHAVIPVFEPSRCSLCSSLDISQERA